MSDAPQWVGKNLGPAVPGKYPTWSLHLGLIEIRIEKRTTDASCWWDISAHGAQAVGLPREKWSNCSPCEVVPPDHVFEAALSFARARGYGILDAAADSQQRRDWIQKEAA